MRKQILNIVTALAIGSFLFVSCSESESHNDAQTEMHENGEGHDHAATYQCPMDCENGKTYEEPGKCPVCNMKLTKVEHNH